MPQCLTCPTIVPPGVTRCAACTLQLKRPDSVRVRSGDAYHISLRDEERKNYELWSFNFYKRTGYKMPVKPELYHDLKRGGCSMKYFLAVEDIAAHEWKWNVKGHTR